jgi:hypothetical protein
MRITDLDMATLRALLVNDFDEYRRLIDQHTDEETKRGYFPLLTAAFFIAVEQRFNRKPRSEIVEWVADVRARMDANDQIDPNVAEKLILWVFGKASTDDVDVNTDFGHQTMLLGLLIREREFSDPELDAFLQQARDTFREAEAESGH